MSDSPIRIDRDLSEEVKRQFSEMNSRNRAYNRFSNTFSLFLLQAISNSVKIFVRKDIGRLTFGVGTIIAAYFWVRYFMGGEVDFLRLGVPEIPTPKWINEFLQQLNTAFGGDGNSALTAKEPIPEYYDLDGYLGYLLKLIYMFFLQLAVLFGRGLQLRPPETEFILIYGFSYAVVFKGLLMIWQSNKKYNQRESFDPLSRGESLVFSSLEGKTIWNLNISRKIILMWLDPIFVVLIGLCLWIFNGNFGIFVMISGIVFFFEERAVQYRERKAVLNKLATDRWTKRVLDEYKEFKEGKKEGVGDSFGTVRFAEDENEEIENPPDDPIKPDHGTADFA